MKKTVFVTLTATVLALVMLPATVLAHGHSAKAANYTLCQTADCTSTKVHQHNGTYYGGHTLSDGHDNHQLCSLEGCTNTAVHDHDGTICFPHSTADGHGYHNKTQRGRGHH